jgi:hypothetical protein
VSEHACRTINVHCPECIPGAEPVGVITCTIPSQRDEAPKTQPEKDEWIRTRLLRHANLTFCLLMATQSRRDMSADLAADLGRVLQMLDVGLARHKERLSAPLSPDDIAALDNATASLTPGDAAGLGMGWF